MKITTDVPQKVDTSKLFCPNLACSSRGLIGQGNIISHGSKRPRFKCKTCNKTFSTRAGTVFEGIRKPEDLFVLVTSLLSDGCPIQTIVRTYHLDERTVANWRDRAELHGEDTHNVYKMQYPILLQEDHKQS